MSRIIINIEGDISDEKAIDLVKQVVKGGRVSVNTKGIKHYCWCTTWESPGRHEERHVVFVNRKKKGQTSDSFNVWKEED